MNKLTRAAVVAALLAAAGARADDFSGGYVGGSLGLNRSSTSGALTTAGSNAASSALEGGYGWNVGNTLLGVEGFVDANQQATHDPNALYGSSAYGLGLKVGVPLDSLMPYARLGYGRTRGSGALSSFSAASADSGLGLVYKFAPSWSVEGEWSTASPAVNGLSLKKDSFSLGLNYHFDTPHATDIPGVWTH